ncbi:hypothetical protein I553_9067 [Mycobacterium xenopi 4042]|uniref:Uncharacterized protein n=1 Tax=Mycobacterium xenopi 4042 TaxID=1299334 RepID=X8AM26_MYCXE|nr:hypothetical protein I553_9067 [Mycobacterium xenopi 4042]
MGGPCPLTLRQRQRAACGIGGSTGPTTGRLTADGLVAVQIPVNERTAGDTRANAVSNVGVLVAPVPVTKDLRELRAASNTR